MDRKSPDQSIESCILVINGGSSSIKFAVFSEISLKKKLDGKIDRIGLPGTTLAFNYFNQGRQDRRLVEAPDYLTAVNLLIERLAEEMDFSSIKAIGHRVVHGMKYIEPISVTKEVLEELHRISSYDPDHLVGEIKLIEAFRQRYPHIEQIAFFDTAFHQTMPRVAKILPIPRQFDEMGIQRYGFHGISYSYLMGELLKDADLKAAQGRVILAHLGNGASLAAVLQGKSIDTSMGFTPTGGLPMSTRTGDLDPGVAWYLMKSQKLTAEKFNNLINYRSGLLGISETSSDVRDLLEQQVHDVRSAEAIELFCYQTRKWIGSFASALEGLDTLVFSAGIGENSPEIRQRICKGLEFLGIKLDEKRNAENSPVISKDLSPVTVRVIKTNEELMIAKGVSHILKGNN